MVIKILGPTVVEGPDGQVVRVTGKKLPALLTCLTVAPGHRRRRSDLSLELWPDCPLQESRRNLRQAIFALKHVLEPLGADVIQTDEEWVWIEEEGLTSDWDVLRSAAASEAVDDWSQAIASYRGSVLPDSLEPSCVAFRHEVESVLSEVVFKAVNASCKAGDLTTALKAARTAVDVDPYSERASFAVVRLLIKQGKLKLASQEYDAYTTRLWKNLRRSPTKPFSQMLDEANSDDVVSSERPITSEKARTKKPRAVWIVACTVFLCVAAWGVLGNRPPASVDSLKAEFEAMSAPQNGRFDRPRAAQVLAELGELAFAAQYGRDEVHWVEEFAGKWDLILDVMDWCVRERPDLAVRLGGSLARYAFMARHDVEWGQRLLPLMAKDPKADPSDIARCQVACTFNDTASWEGGKAVERYAEEARAYYRMTGQIWGEAQAVRGMGMVRSTRRQWKESLPYYDEAERLYRRTGRREGLALNRICQSIADVRDAPDRSQELTRQTECAMLSLDDWLEVGNEWGIKFSTNVLCGKLRTYTESGVRSEARLLWSARERVDRLLNLETLKSDGASQDLLKLTRLRISIRLDDRKGTAFGLYGAGSWSLIQSWPERYKLLVAVRKLDPEFYDSQHPHGYVDQILEAIENEAPGSSASLVKECESLRPESVYPWFWR